MTNMPPSDANLDLDLLGQMRAGDQKALSVLYARHQAPLYRFAMLRSGSAPMAGDVVQDIFVALIEDRLTFDPARGSLAGFLFGVARNFILKREEAARRFLPIQYANDESEDEIDIDFVDINPLPLEKILADDRAEAVRRALNKISPHYRDVLILYEMQDLSYVEIAHICNIDIGTVRSRLSRARAKLLLLLSRSEAINSDQQTRHSAREASHESKSIQ
jgi:RNA polymerase sigma-70 factor, ECF subfamily